MKRDSAYLFDHSNFNEVIEGTSISDCRMVKIGANVSV